MVADCSFEVIIHCLSGEDEKTRSGPTLKCLQRKRDTGLSDKDLFVFVVIVVDCTSFLLLFVISTEMCFVAGVKAYRICIWYLLTKDPEILSLYTLQFSSNHHAL